jgi:hypothetical protein
MVDVTSRLIQIINGDAANFISVHTNLICVKEIKRRCKVTITAEADRYDDVLHMWKRTKFSTLSYARHASPTHGTSYIAHSGIDPCDIEIAAIEMARYGLVMVAQISGRICGRHIWGDTNSDDTYNIHCKIVIDTSPFRLPDSDALCVRWNVDIIPTKIEGKIKEDLV